MPLVSPTVEMSVVLKDYNGMPYMNDFVDINILFGMGQFLAAYPVGAAAFTTPFGTGPGLPGLIYPEIYLPANHQMLIDIQQTAAGTPAIDLLVNFIGAKIFKGAQ